MITTVAFAAILSACRRDTTRETDVEMHVLPPVEGTWSRVGDMLEVRVDHAVVALPDGSALAIGGVGGVGDARLATVERFDPLTNRWERRASLPAPASDLRTAVLRDGRVLACGGKATHTAYLDRCALYDPGKDEWRPAAKLPWPRIEHELVVFTDGRVLVVGGRKELLAVAAEAAVYDPKTDAWAETGTLAVARTDHTATLLLDGRVAVIGGQGTSSGTRTASIELFDPEKRTWTTGGALPEPRSGHAALLRPDGTVLVAGGETDVGPMLTPVEKTFAIFDPKTGKIVVGLAPHRRTRGQALPLTDHRVLLLDSVDENIHDGAPLIIDATKNGSALGPAWPRAPSLLHERIAAVLRSGRILAAGGSLESGTRLAETWLLELGRP
jgi:hypothetical protein